VAESPTPKDAAAVILLRPNTDPNNPEVFWVKRSTKLAFLGGFYAFPGGQREASDADVPVNNCDDPERAAMISCAAREIFEEVGVLLARGAETLTVGQRASLLDDLESKRMSWPELLQHYGLRLDASDFTFVGRWVTPPFAPRRFDTWFFLVNCPPKQEPRVTEDSELESGEWIRARAAYAKWESSEIIAVPPVLHALKTLAGGLTVDLVEHPARHAQPVGRIAEVLGHHADPGMEIEIALRKFDLPHRFSKGALALAKSVPDEVRPQDIEGRRDLRELEFVTIDGETAKDFDDAVVCRKEGKGFRLWVAIADVSHYVKHGDALDLEARERGTSVYFPRRVIPMLPEKLSNGICSLNPKVDRLAMVCEVEISAQGELGRYEFYPAVFRSQARLTYTKVWADIAGGNPPGHLARLNELFQALYLSREKRGAIDFETIETRMVFDPKGKIEKIVPEARNDAHRIIEECMLAANVCAGNFIAERGQPVLYRVHDAPAEEKVTALRAFLGELGLGLPGGDIPKPRDYAGLLEKIRGRPDFQLLQTVLLRSLKQAMYTPENVGHFGLAFDAYVHFTSPIRRYPDLLVHRAIKALLAGKRYDGGIDWLALGRHCSETERRADDASRDVESWLKCYYMRDHVGGVFSGTITGVVPFGLFVTLDEYFVDGLVHISELGRDYFQYDGARHLLFGERTKKRFRLADRMKVKLVRVDVDQRKIDLVPA